MLACLVLKGFDSRLDAIFLVKNGANDQNGIVRGAANINSKFKGAHIIIVVGESGQLAQEVQRQLASRDKDFITVSLRALTSMSIDQVTSFWNSISSSHTEIELLWISGVINPNVDKIELSLANFEIPARVIGTLSKRGCLVRVITIGSVLEALEEVNEYIESKKQLSSFLARELNQTQYLHVRTHTLVGTVEPPAHMFLGQLSRALKTSTSFTMSSGTQTREYIPYTAVASFLSGQVGMDAGTNDQGIKSLGGAEPVKLIDLALTAATVLNPRVSVDTDDSLDPPSELFGAKPKNDILLKNLDSSMETALRFLRVWSDFHPRSRSVFPKLR